MKNLKSRTEKNKADFWFTPEEDAMMLFNTFKAENKKKYLAKAGEKGFKQMIKNLSESGMKPEDITRVTNASLSTIDMVLKDL